MEYIKILSIPKLIFAHKFGTERYNNTLPKRNNFIEISFIKSGSLIRMANGESIHCKTNYVLCNNYLNEIKILSDHYHQHHTVAFEVEFAISSSPQQDFTAFPSIIPSSDIIYTIQHDIDKIIELSENHNTPNVALSGLFMQLLGKIDQTVRLPHEKLNYKYEYYTRKVKTYISQNITKKITQREIAEYLNLTPQYLCSVFKMCTGDSVIKYINKLKLKQIKILCEREKVKLQKASIMYGFSDPNYVSRLYKKYFNRNITYIE